MLHATRYTLPRYTLPLLALALLHTTRYRYSRSRCAGYPLPLLATAKRYLRLCLRRKLAPHRYPLLLPHVPTLRRYTLHVTATCAPTPHRYTLLRFAPRTRAASLLATCARITMRKRDSVSTAYTIAGSERTVYMCSGHHDAITSARHAFNKVVLLWSPWLAAHLACFDLTLIRCFSNISLEGSLSSSYWFGFPARRAGPASSSS
ncbi:hypothetical protein B0H14DRAFT_3497659 [Mycena olivaceomarginata]|nr:hypothetical protein B0H14DRAFT_3497659 [Mycena olivaceomarginata]